MSDDKSAQGSADESGKGDEGSADESGKGAQEAKEQVRDPEAVAAKNVELLEELKTSKDRLAEFETAEEERRTAALSEQEKALEDATAAGKAQAMEDLGAKLLQERLVNLATGVFIDPTDALIVIGKATLDLDKPDTLESALSELGKQKPHLLLNRRKSGGIDQGPQGGYVKGETGDDWLRGVMGG